MCMYLVQFFENLSWVWGHGPLPPAPPWIRQCYRPLIGSDIWPIEWQQYWWPWVTAVIQLLQAFSNVICFYSCLAVDKHFCDSWAPDAVTDIMTDLVDDECVVTDSSIPCAPFYVLFVAYSRFFWRMMGGSAVTKYVLSCLLATYSV